MSDEESLIGDIIEQSEREQNEIEDVIQYNEVEIEDPDAQSEGQNEDAKSVKPKRVIKNPQPKLNEQTLKTAKGLGAIEKCFERVKFKGREYEEQDLNVIMKTYEYWCHRMFPKFPFDDCINRLEKLGSKRATQTYVKRIRHNLIFDESEIIREDDEIGEEGITDVVTLHSEENETIAPLSNPDS